MLYTPLTQFLSHMIIIHTRKIVTKTTELFLEDGCINLSCIKLGVIN